MLIGSYTPYQMFVQALKAKDIKAAFAALYSKHFNSEQITVDDLIHVAKLGKLALFNELFRKNDKGDYIFPAAQAATVKWDVIELENVAEMGHDNIVNRLLQKNASMEYEFSNIVASIGRWDNIVLLGAVSKGQLNIVNRLLQKNASGEYEFPIVVNNLWKPFVWAAEFDCLDVLNRFLALNDAGDHYEFRTLVERIARNHNEALKSAAQRGMLRIVDRLLARNAAGEYEFQAIVEDIAVANNGVFRGAIAKGQLTVVERLLAKNAAGTGYEFWNIIDAIHDGHNGIQEACAHGHLHVLNRLLQKDATGAYEFPTILATIAANENAPLREAAKHGHLNIVNRLLAKNAAGGYDFPNVVAAIAVGDNAVLQGAAANAHLKVVNRLLQKNADGQYEFQAVVDAIAVKNCWVLAGAVRGAHRQVINRLLQLRPVREALTAPPKEIKVKKAQAAIHSATPRYLPNPFPFSAFYQWAMPIAGVASLEFALDAHLLPPLISIVQEYLSDFDIMPNASYTCMPPEYIQKEQSQKFIQGFDCDGEVSLKGINALLPDNQQLAPKKLGVLRLSSSLSVFSLSSRLSKLRVTSMLSPPGFLPFFGHHTRTQGASIISSQEHSSEPEAEQAKADNLAFIPRLCGG